MRYIGTGQADIGLTYNAAAEQRAVDSGIAVKKELIFKVSRVEQIACIALITLNYRIISTWLVRHATLPICHRRTVSTTCSTSSSLAGTRI